MRHFVSTLEMAEYFGISYDEAVEQQWVIAEQQGDELRDEESLRELIQRETPSWK